MSLAYGEGAVEKIRKFAGFARFQWRAWAEVIAQGLTAVFVHNFDSLVTNNYLDTRFSEQSVRMELLATDVDPNHSNLDYLACVSGLLLSSI